MDLEIVAARAKNGVIGRGLDIPWQAKGEQKIFKDITMGGTLIMGRVTFDSIGRPLPGRKTIIITGQENYTQSDCLIAHSLDEAITLAQEVAQPIFIVGGGKIYAEALPRADILHLTTIETEPEGDVYFPDVDMTQYELVEEKTFSTNMDYTYQKLKRVS